MMTTLPDIGMLWMEGRLSYLEQLCIVSFRDAGHRVVLYHYGPLENVPDGIELADASEILPRAGDGLTHARTGSPALHSDLFRYRMLKKEPGMIWADTDAYCLRPFTTETGHFHGWESKHHINGGVLGLPADSDTLRELLAFTDDVYSIPPWYPETEKAEYAQRAAAGDPVHAGEMRWGVWGPHALTHFLHATGEAVHAFPRHVLYPFSFPDRRLMLRRGLDDSDYLKPDTLSVHFYGRRMRKRLVEAEGGVPKRWSLIGKLLKRHNVDPSAAPLPGAPPVKVVEAVKDDPLPLVDADADATTAPNALAPRPPHPGAGANLTDLADHYGSDKGSTKHRYTELYHILFHPYRDREITFLEMGLQIGGPEHGHSEDRETTDLPSVRMWLDYFSRAEIFGLDVSDFSWFSADRFRFLRCDMDDRTNLDRAASELPDLDIVIDDASHASMHQQQGFLALWPRVKPGGLYIIEDLRWQPDVYESKHPGLTKTAALFQEWLRHRVFQHSDPAMAAAFNDLAPEISGCFLTQAHFDKARKDQVVVVHKR